RQRFGPCKGGTRSRLAMRDMNSRRENNSLDERIGKLLLEREVEDFIAREAAMLDEWRLDEWLGLFTDDGRYVVPSTDVPGGDPKETLGIINDDMARLRGRGGRGERPRDPPAVSRVA